MSPDRVGRTMVAYEGAAGVSVILVDGTVTGVWERQLRGKNLKLTAVPAHRLTRPLRTALETEAARIADFYDARLTLTIEES